MDGVPDEVLASMWQRDAYAPRLLGRCDIAG